MDEISLFCLWPVLNYCNFKDLEFYICLKVFCQPLYFISGDWQVCFNHVHCASISIFMLFSASNVVLFSMTMKKVVHSLRNSQDGVNLNGLYKIFEYADGLGETEDMVQRIIGDLKEVLGNMGLEINED